MKYFIISCIIVTVIFCCYAEYQEKKKLDFNSFGWIISSAVFGVISGCGLYLLSGMIFNFTAQTEWVVQTDANIIALEDNFTTSGSRCLFAGRINETLKYSYVHKQPDGGMKTYNVPASSSTIYYIEDDECPHIQYLYKEFKNQTLKKIYGEGKDSVFTEQKYRIYVPQGTILEEYNIDLKK